MKPKIKILIVDDEPRWVEFARKDLSNFAIVVAKDKQTALERLEENDYDLVIASARRLDVLEEIRKKRAQKRVIVMTIQPTTTEALNAFRLGATRYLPKSFSPQELLSRVKEIIPSSFG